MNQALEVLAKLGRNEPVSLDTLPAHIAAMIEAKDVQALSRELDLVPDIVCIMLPAEDEQDEEEEDTESKPAKEELSRCA